MHHRAARNSDQLIVTGTVTLGGTLDEQAHQRLPSRERQRPSPSSTTTLADAVSGTFAGLSEGEFFTHNGSSYSISYVGGDGNDVVLTAANDAPVITLAGDLDALVANSGSDNVSVLHRQRRGRLHRRHAGRHRQRPRSVALGDVDGDGDLDALVANANSNNVSVLHRQRRGRLHRCHAGRRRHRPRFRRARRR